MSAREAKFDTAGLRDGRRDPFSMHATRHGETRRSSHSAVPQQPDADVLRLQTSKAAHVNHLTAAQPKKMFDVARGEAFDARRSSGPTAPPQTGQQSIPQEGQRSPDAESSGSGTERLLLEMYEQPRAMRSKSTTAAILLLRAA